MIQGSQTRNALAGLIQKPLEGVADLVDEMDKDYQVKLADLTLCSGVKQVKVTFTTDKGDARAEAVKDFAEKLYYDSLSSMLAFLKYGRVAYERAWKYEAETNLNTFDLNELPYRQTKMRLQNGQFAGVELKGKDEQKNPVTVNLDKAYAWWLAYNAKPTTPHGTSSYVGAPCDTYYERRNTRKMLRTFLDKYALGNRILYGPEKIPDPNNPDPTAPMVPFADVVRPVLQILEAGGWLILSNERQTSGSDGKDVGYKIEVKSDEGVPQQSEPILRVMEEQDSWQLLAFGIPPKTVTEGSEVGSFAMVAQQRVVLLALFEEIFLQIQKQFQAGVLDVLCEMNGTAPVSMDYTPLTERPDDLASEVVKAWLTTPKLSELVSSGTVDVMGLLDATAIPVTPEGKERLTKLITRLANPPAQPTNPDGTIKTPEQLKAEYAVKAGEDPDDPDAGKPAPPKPPFGLSSPFTLGTLWPADGVTALCGANGPGGEGFQPGNTCGKGSGGGHSGSVDPRKMPKDAKVQLYSKSTGEVFTDTTAGEAAKMLDDSVKEGQDIDDVGVRELTPEIVKKQQTERSLREHGRKAEIERKNRQRELETPHGLKAGHDKFVDPPDEMYHATFDADAIVKDGFKSSDELGKQTLGGTSSNLVSFTTKENAELYQHALNVSRKAARDELSGDELVKVATQFGVSETQAREILKTTRKGEKRSFDFLQQVSFTGKKFPLFMGGNWPAHLKTAAPARIVAIKSKDLGDVYYNPTEKEWRISGYKRQKPRAI